MHAHSHTHMHSHGDTKIGTHRQKLSTRHTPSWHGVCVRVCVCKLGWGWGMFVLSVYANKFLIVTVGHMISSKKHQ